MRREFLEETGAKVQEWREYVDLQLPYGNVYFLVAHGAHKLTSVTDEKVRWYKTSDIPKLPVVENVKWLVPLALDKTAKRAVVEDSQTVNT